MIVPFLAGSVWLVMLAPPAIRLGVALGLCVFAFLRFRKTSWLVVAGICLALVSLSLNQHPPVRQLANGFESRDVQVIATEDGQRLTKVRLLHVPDCNECSGALGQYVGTLNAGEQASGLVMFRPAFEYGEFVLRGTLRVASHKANQKSAFIKASTGVSSDARALVLGLSVGDTSTYSQEFLAKLKTLSLTHLSAVSGANCAVVVGAVYWCLGFLIKRRWIRTLCAILALLAYVQVVGYQASVLRAAVMAVIVLMAIARGVWPMAALSWAVVALLYWQPNFATDYGFALSVFATAAILVLAPALTEKFAMRLPKALSLALAVTVSAQLWCMPILLGLQGGVPTYSVLANLLAEPVVAPVTVLGIAAAFAPWPWLIAALTWLASLPAQWIVAVANYLSQLPATTIAWHTGLLGMLAVVGGLSLWLTKPKKIGAALVALVLAVEFGWAVFGAVRAVTWLPANWEIVNCDVGQGDGLVIRSAGQIGVVDVGRNDRPIQECLDGLHVNHIDLLVLTHYDADHIGGLQGALRGRTVDRVLVTPFHDTRPLVAKTQALIVGARQVIRAGIGLTGRLGSDSWEVLSPTSSAEEAEDSNDGSIVMRWEGPNWMLYTMADLGERGQMRMVERYGASLYHPADKWLILKVSHHGSADQYPELLEAMRPDLALISVGKDNSYGHPTQRTLKTLEDVGAKILRTDQNGELAVFGNLRFAVSGGS